MLLVRAVPAGAADVKINYLFNLSSFTGPVKSSWAMLSADQQRRELFVINSSDGTVEIYNSSGLLVYTFGEDGALGAVSSIAVGENGDMFILSGYGTDWKLLLANFRGDIQETMSLRGLPPLFLKDFSPTRIFYRKGELHLVDTTNFKILRVDVHGNYLSGMNLAPLIGIDFKKVDDFTVGGCSLDSDGNYLFTLPIQALVYIVSPDGKTVQSFGRRGSSPGKFNIIGGVGADDKGNIYVTDTLRCVIMVFARDKDFTFKGQFSERGFGPGELIAPKDMVIVDNRLYVAQAGNRGVGVFILSYN